MQCWRCHAKREIIISLLVRVGVIFRAAIYISPECARFFSNNLRGYIIPYLRCLIDSSPNLSAIHSSKFNTRAWLSPISSLSNAGRLRCSTLFLSLMNSSMFFLIGSSSANTSWTLFARSHAFLSPSTRT